MIFFIYFNFPSENYNKLQSLIFVFYFKEDKLDKTYQISHA